MQPHVLAQFQQAVNLAQTGQKAAAYQELLALVEQSKDNQSNPDLWLWLAFTSPNLIESERAIYAAAQFLSTNHPSLVSAWNWLRAEQQKAAQAQATAKWEHPSAPSPAYSALSSSPSSVGFNLPNQNGPASPGRPASHLNSPPTFHGQNQKNADKYGESEPTESSYRGSAFWAKYNLSKTVALPGHYSLPRWVVISGVILGLILILGGWLLLSSLDNSSADGDISGTDNTNAAETPAEAYPGLSDRHAIKLNPAIIAAPAEPLRQSSAGWTVQVFSQDKRALRGVKCLSAQKCLAGGDGGLYFVTADAGKNWQYQHFDYELKDLNCPTTANCRFAIQSNLINHGHNGFIYTNNSAKNWFWATYDDIPDMAGTISCPDAQHCYGIGGDRINCATFLENQIGLATCPLNSGGYNMHSIFCASTYLCLAVGDAGRIISLDQTPGQKVWYDRASATGQNLTGLTCTKTQLCIVVGNQGTILQSNDGGTTWRSTAIPGTSRSNLHAVNCPTSKTCLAAGDQGTLLLTKDGGNSWLPQDSGTLANLYAISCSGSGLCVAVGENATIVVNRRAF